MSPAASSRRSTPRPRTLFGSWLTTQTFTDLFHGTDADGRRFAIYEADALAPVGQEHASSSSPARSTPSSAARRSAGRIVVVPDRGIFNFFKPAARHGAGRVRERSRISRRSSKSMRPSPRRRSCCSAARPAASSSNGGKAARSSLMSAPRTCSSPSPARIASRSGSMFRIDPEQERVRTMFDEVRASLATLRSVKAALD